MPDGQLKLGEWLGSQGFDGPAERDRAMAALREAGILSARPKTFISEDKRGPAEAALAARFVVHCADLDCARFARRWAARRSAAAVLTARRNACGVCRGSNSRRAFERARDACVRARITRWLIVGGSPNLRQDLKRYLEDAPELEVTLDEGDSNDAKAARARAQRAQAIVILSTSQINHKDTAIYTGEFKPRLILVPARGLEALFEAMERRVGGGR